VTAKIHENLLPDTDIQGYVCSEGERDAADISEVRTNLKTGRIERSNQGIPERATRLAESLAIVA
jgi:hypothetical protein